MVIFSSVRLGVSPQINALATVILVTVAVIVTLAGKLMARSARGAAPRPLQES
jgi:putrescine transport system permease protein